MREFNGGSDRGSREHRGPRRGGFRNEDREMHDAVCAECGNKCQVPFQPKEGRPVYCRDCFSKQRKDRF